VVFFGLPLFWLGAKILRTRYVLLCLLSSLLVPANSSIGMFPSPNVPGSARLLTEKKREIAAVADSLARQKSCFVGSYTNDYVASTLLEKGGWIEGQQSAIDFSVASIRMPNGSIISFRRINPRLKFVPLGTCQSLEYSREGQKVRFMGGEWRIPIM
jgi:hypothetical protein